MLNTIKSAALSAIIGLGVLGGSAVGAQAAPATPVAKMQSGLVVDVQFRDHRRHGRPAACTPQRAVSKAWRIGINRPVVRNANRNVIRVAGFSRGKRVNVVFARAPGCPVIR